MAGVIKERGAQWLRTMAVQILAVDFRPVGREVEVLLSGGSRVGGAGSDGRGGRNQEQRRDESALGGKGQARSGVRFPAWAVS